jgi:hypothetical protein
VPPPARGLVTLRDKDAAIVVDDSAGGIVFATWFGEATISLVDQYYEWNEAVLERARRERTKFVLVTDTFGAARPSPAARKRIAERFARMPRDVGEITIASYIIIENALLRGVVTALAWMDPRLEGSVTVASVPLAIEGAIKSLTAAGVTPPANLTPESYKRPPRP